MATTTNFGWETPDDTDLVKDGALAMRTLGNSIDTSFVDLKGGTTGQVLSKASNTDLDFTWVAQDDSNAIQNAIIDAKGDLIVGTAADTPARLAVGTNGHVLTADSAEASGMKWAAAASGALVKISSNPFSNVSSVTVDSVFSSTYKSYLVVIDSIYAATAADDLYLQLRYGSTTQVGGYYGSSLINNYANSTVTNTGSNNASQFTIYSGTSGSQTPNGFSLFFSNIGAGATVRPSIWGNGYGGDAADVIWLGALNVNLQSYSGFILKSASSNITGNVTTYGLVA